MHPSSLTSCCAKCNKDLRQHQDLAFAILKKVIEAHPCEETAKRVAELGLLVLKCPSAQALCEALDNLLQKLLVEKK